MADAVGNGGVDGEFGHIAFDAAVVVSLVVAHQAVRPKGGQFAALLFHFVRGLPAAHDDLPHAAHGLRIRREHADCAQVVQDVFGSDGFFADAALGKCQILGDGRIQVVAHHQHVHVFVQRVDGVGACGVGGGGQHIGLAHHFQNVRRMAATRAFGVKGVDGATLECGHRVFHKTRLIQGVGMDGDLGVGGLGHVQTVVDGRWRGAPVFVQLQANRTCVDLFKQRIGQRGIPLAQKT